MVVVFREVAAEEMKRIHEKTEISNKSFTVRLMASYSLLLFVILCIGVFFCCFSVTRMKREVREQNPQDYLVPNAQGDPLTTPEPEERYWDSTLFEDPAQIQLLASLVVPCWAPGEPVAEVQFYFPQEGEDPRTVLIPLERIPQQLRAQFHYYQLAE